MAAGPSCLFLLFRANLSANYLPIVGATLRSSRPVSGKTLDQRAPHTTVWVARFYVASALSTTLTHFGSGEASAAYLSCQFHHLYGGVWG